MDEPDYDSFAAHLGEPYDPAFHTIEGILEKEKSTNSYRYTRLLRWLLDKTVSEIDQYLKGISGSEIRTDSDITDSFLLTHNVAKNRRLLEQTLVNYIIHNVDSLRKDKLFGPQIPSDDPNKLEPSKVIVRFFGNLLSDENVFIRLAQIFAEIITNLDALALEAKAGLPWLLQYVSSDNRTIKLKQLKLNVTGDNREPHDHIRDLHDHIGVLIYLIHLTLAPHEVRRWLRREWRKYRVEELRGSYPAVAKDYPIDFPETDNSHPAPPSADLDIPLISSGPCLLLYSPELYVDAELCAALNLDEHTHAAIDWATIYLDESPMETFGNSRALNEWHSLPTGSKSEWNFFKSRADRIVDQYLKIHGLAEGVDSAKYNTKLVPSVAAPPGGFSRFIKNAQ